MRGPIYGEINAAAEKLGVSVDDLKSNSRMHHLVDLRAAVYGYLTESRGYSCSDVARAFNKDHTTVLHALKTLNDRKAALVHLDELRGDPRVRYIVREKKVYVTTIKKPKLSELAARHLDQLKSEINSAEIVESWRLRGIVADLERSVMRP